MAHKVKQHVFLVDNNQTTLKSMNWMLKTTGMTISCFSDPDKCLEQLGSRRCDLLIANQELPEMDGIKLLRRAKYLNPGLTVLIISSCSDIPTVVESMKAGAEDFLKKPLSKKSLLQKVKLILQENGIPSDPYGGQVLSHAEMRVLKHVADGKTSPEIARLLHRSYRTIQFHRARLLRKLSVKNSVALVQKAQAMGLISVEPNQGARKTTRKSKKKR